MEPAITSALDDLDAAAEGVSLAPVDLGATYIHVRPKLDVLVAGMKASTDAELARVGRVFDNLLAGADTVLEIPSDVTGSTTGGSAAAANKTPTAP